MDLGIQNRVAVITGGDSGMGLATAKILANEGVKIALIDKTDDQLDHAVETISKIGEVIGVSADLTQLDQVESAKQRIVDHYGQVHILVNAAGITGATKPFLELTDQDWWETINVDLMIAVRVCRAFIPLMQAAQWGRIILFASEDALQPYVDEMPYCAAKAGVLNLTKNLSRAFARDNILVNAVSPAFIATPMTDSMMKQRAEEKGMDFEEAIATFLEEKRPYLELNRRGEADEVAATVSFLCSELASFTTGSNYRVDGGSVATI